MCEVALWDFLSWDTKGPERLEYLYCVINASADPDIEVATGTRMSMRRNSVCTNDKIVGFSVVPRKQHVAKVYLQIHWGCANFQAEIVSSQTVANRSVDFSEA